MRKRQHNRFHSAEPYGRRTLLRGLGAAGLSLVIGRGCTTKGEAAPTGVDRGHVFRDTGASGVDRSRPPADTGLSGADSGLPPIDLAAPKVTQTATFALG